MLNSEEIKPAAITIIELRLSEGRDLFRKVSCGSRIPKIWQKTTDYHLWIYKFMKLQTILCLTAQIHTG